MPHVGFTWPRHDYEYNERPWEATIKWSEQVRSEWQIHRLNNARKAVSVNRVERHNNKFVARNVLHEIGLPAIKATHSLKTDYRSRPTLCFPACVTNGDVFAMAGSASMSGPLEPVTFMAVTYMNQARWMQYEDSQRNVFDVVGFKNLDYWLDHVDTLAERMAPYLR